MMASRPGSVRLLAVLAAAASLPACSRPPDLPVRAILGDSRSPADLRRVSLPAGTEAASVPLPAPCGDLSRGPRGEIYLAAGREVLLLEKDGDLVPLVRVGEKIDTVLPSADGRWLYILEHPPAGAGAGRRDDGTPGPPPGSAAAPRTGERQAPHRLRAWDLGKARFAGEVELDPLGFEIHAAPGLVLATHLKGRRIEAVPAGPEGFAGPAETIDLPPPDAGPVNRQAVVRAAAVEPVGRWALLVESGAGGDFERTVLWTLDLAGRTPRAHPIAARGFFHDAVLFLDPGPSGRARALIDGRDRIVVVEGGPEEGFREGEVLRLPGRFFDPRPVPPGPAGRPAGGAAGLVLLAGHDPARREGLLALVDPAGPRLVWTWRLPAPADLLELEPD